jgi:hypothetical protein
MITVDRPIEDLWRAQAATDVALRKAKCTQLREDWLEYERLVNLERMAELAFEQEESKQERMFQGSNRRC